jgi:hypothetical protein
LAVIVVGEAATGFGKRAFPEAFRYPDPTLEAVEWTPLRRELATRGYLDRKDMFVVAPYWIDAARIDQALGGALPVIAFGDWNEPKNFELRYDRRTFLGRDALIIGVHIRPWVEARLRPFFASIEELPPVVFGRSGMPEISLRVLLGRKLLAPFPSYYAPDAPGGGGNGGAAPAR